MKSTFDTVRTEALFASALQASQAPSPVQVRAAVTSTLRRLGVKGWALRMIEAAYQDLVTREFAYAG